MEKLPYIIFGMGLAWLPFILTRWSHTSNTTLSRIISLPIWHRHSRILWILLVIVSYGCIAWHNVQFMLPLILLSLAPPLILRLSSNRFNFRCYALTTLCLAAGVRLMWWMNDSWNKDIPYFQIAIFLIFATGVAWLLLKERTSSPHNEKYIRFSLALFALCTVLYAFNSSFLALPRLLKTTLLHWGAYIGPAQIVAAGGQPLIDIPLQYGLGPTMLIASGLPFFNSWLWMHIVSSSLLVCYALCLAGMLILICRNSLSKAQIGVLLMTAFICVFYWSGFPSSKLIPSPMVYPSVHGMRYLPVMLMGLFSIRHALKKGETLCCHLIWCLSLIWSPEAAFYASLVWCPYYLFFQLHEKPGASALTLFLLFKRGMILVGWIMLCLSTVLACFYAAYGALPSWEFYAVYVLNPPGTLPINLRGSVWFFLLVFVGGGYLLTRSALRKESPEHSAVLFITLLMLYGTSSYFFLGRSHDNSVANLSPFLLLVISASWTLAPEGHERDFRKLLILPLACLWLLTPRPHMPPLDLQSSYSLSSVVDKFDFRYAAHSKQQKEKQALLTPLIEAGDPVISFFQVPIPPLTDRVWSGLNLYINFVIIPYEIRQKALWNIKERFNRPGWLLVDHRVAPYSTYSPERAIALYETAYKRGETIRMGDIDAIYFTPLPSNPLVTFE